MKRGTRIFALLLALAMVISWLPTNLAAAQETEAIEKTRSETIQETSLTANLLSRPRERAEEVPVKSTAVQSPVVPESAYDSAEEVFAQINAAEAAPAKKNANETSKTDAAIAVVMASDSYVEGSLERNGNSFTWWTTDGIRCFYDPRMREKTKDLTPEKGLDAIVNEPQSLRGGSPTGTQVYLVGPYYGYDSSFTNQYRNEAATVAAAIGDTDGYTLYSGSSASVDKVAQALSNGAVVFFDSHGMTDYTNPYNEDDCVTGANYSYLCLTNTSGLTQADYDDGAICGYTEDGLRIAAINGAVMSNHMTKNSPSGILWMAICLGMGTNSICQPMRSRGVEVVYGYSESVTFGGDYCFEETFWQEMRKGKTVAQAIATMKSTWGNWDWSTQIFGSDGYSSISTIRSLFKAFPVVVSDEDAYPGQRTAYSYGADSLQTVKSTYTLNLNSSSVLGSGYCGYGGTNLSWILNNQGVLTISGEGYMADYDDADLVPWASYREQIQKVVIGEGVMDIGKRAFFGCSSLQTVSLPSTLSYGIGEAAFSECTQLSSITLPQNLTYIGVDAFSFCEALTSISIPAKVETIDDYAFWACYNLKTLTLQEGLKTIGAKAFAYCEALQSVTIPASVTSMEEIPFLCCYSLSGITVKSGNSYYSSDAYGVLFNKNKTTLLQAAAGISGAYTVPSTVTAIQSGAFCDCDNLTVLYLPAGLTTMDGFAIESCDKLSGIWAHANSSYFSNDTYGVLYDKNKTTLRQATGTLTGRFEIPQGVTSIFNGAFFDSHINQLYIPSSVTSIGLQAFGWCYELTDVYYQGTASQWQNVSIADYNEHLTEAVFHYNAAPQTQTLAITSHPASVTIQEGKEAVFQVAASGSDLKYQWQYSTNSGTSWINSTSTGCSTDQLDILATLVRSGYMYRCKVTDGSGNVVYSNAATLTVQKESFAVTKQPQSVSVTEGDTATFSVTASGTGLTYRWQYSADGSSWTDCASSLTGYNSSTLSVPATLSRNGLSYRCKITNAGERTIYSNSAKLTVTEKIAITISKQPANVTVTEGQNATFSVTASGTSLTYQWQYSKDGGTTWTNSSSATTGYNTNKLVVTATLARNGFLYRCKITDSKSNVVYSNAATLTVKQESFAVTKQPQSVSVTEGDTATFSVTASGTGLTYRWQYSADGSSWTDCASSLTGYNGSTLSVPATLARNGLFYRCKITNAGERTIYSSSAKLTVSQRITGQPANVTVYEGEDATFSVTAVGTGLTYQWQYSQNSGTTWTNSSSATQGYNTNKLVVTATLARNGFLYRCKVTDSSGNVFYSASAKLTVKEYPIRITKQPASATVAEGKNATFSVTATGTGLTYQWQYSKDGGNFWTNSSSATQGYNTTAVTVLATLERTGFQYRCKVTDQYGNVAYSDAATLTVQKEAFAVTKQPQNTTATEGDTAVFRVTVSGTGLIYRWQYNNGVVWIDCASDIPGYNSSTLSVPATLARDGMRYRCKIKNAGGRTIFSEEAELTVTEKVTIQISKQPANVTVYEGENATFSVTASGTGLTYQWQYSTNGGATFANSSSATAGYNTPTLTVTGTLARNGFQYRCKITDANGKTVCTNAVTLTVKEQPIRISGQPADVTVYEGENAAFSVTASGTGLTYQWQYSKDGGDYWANSSSATAGYNTASLTVEGALSRNGFLYRCKLTDTYGNVAYSDVAALTVEAYPIQITGQPKNVTAYEEETAIFSVTATGTGLIYQWQYKTTGSQNWANSSSATLGYNEDALWVEATLARSGFQYRCKLTDTAGNVAYSDVATLLVKERPIRVTGQPKDAAVYEGENAAFSVTATGDSLQYQWQYSKNSGASWTNSSSATHGYNTASLTVEGTLARNGFLYRCKLTDAAGNVAYSDAACLTVEEHPIQISGQPAAVTVYEGDNAAFSVEASGDSLQYQWQYSKDGGDYWANSSPATLGYNEAVLCVEATLARNGFLYRCKLTDAAGNVAYSAVAALTVKEVPIRISGQPKDATVYEDRNATFSVTASGTGLTYQWQYSKDFGNYWANSSSATQGYNTDTLVITGTLARNGFLYRCKITDSTGYTTYSDAACLTVEEKPIQISGQPADATIYEGESASFAVTAAGNGITYQWQYSKNSGASWTNSSSATAGYNTDTLTVVGTMVRNGFLYRCKLTDSTGYTTYSDAACLTVEELPVQVTMQPQDSTTKLGNRATFRVEATGKELTYRWQYSTNGNVWYNTSNFTTGYNTPTLTVLAEAKRNGFLYRCRITDPDGNLAYSDVVCLNVDLPAESVIVSQPTDQYRMIGKKAVFRVEYQGQIASFQWQYQNTSSSAWYNSSSATPGYNTDTLTVTAEAKRNGFRYRCLITDAEGYIHTSQEAVLTITKAQFDSDPSDVTAAAGANALFRVSASGSYQQVYWQYSTNGGSSWYASRFTGYNTTAMTVPVTAARDGYLYRCVLIDADGTRIVSQPAQLTVQ